MPATHYLPVTWVLDAEYLTHKRECLTQFPQENSPHFVSVQPGLVVRPV